MLLLPPYLVSKNLTYFYITLTEDFIHMLIYYSNNKGF